MKAKPKCCDENYTIPFSGNEKITHLKRIFVVDLVVLKVLKQGACLTQFITVVFPMLCYHVF